MVRVVLGAASSSMEPNESLNEHIRAQEVHCTQTDIKGSACSESGQFQAPEITKNDARNETESEGDAIENIDDEVCALVDGDFSDPEKEDELNVLCTAGNVAAATSLSLEPSNFMVRLSFLVQNSAKF